MYQARLHLGGEAMGLPACQRSHRGTICAIACVRMLPSTLISLWPVYLRHRTYLVTALATGSCHIQTHAPHIPSAGRKPASAAAQPLAALPELFDRGP